MDDTEKVKLFNTYANEEEDDQNDYYAVYIHYLMKLIKQTVVSHLNKSNSLNKEFQPFPLLLLSF